MHITLWGTRGSIPNPGPANQFYGANTSCAELRLACGDLLIIDAGTGIYSLGRTLPDSGECHLLITHGHDDHVQGLGFFRPFFQPGWAISLYLPENLLDLPDRIFNGRGFPVLFKDLQSRVRLIPVKPGQSLQAGGAGVTALAGNHPGGSLAYRLEADGATVVFSGDHEISADPAARAATAAMLAGADLAVVDAAFSRVDIRPGWGHSAWEDWAEAARGAAVAHLALSHHSPDRRDAELDALQQLLAEEDAASNTQVFVAREGMRFSLPGRVEPDLKISTWLEEFIAELASFRDETTLLDRILSAARDLAHADAGSIYLVEDGELVFAYSQNDSLFPDSVSNKSVYVNMRLPITESSIAGYVAATGKTLNLDDVYDLPPGAPYGFNRSFDQSSGYRTSSVLTMPLRGRKGDMLGVVQLINSKDQRTGQVVPFSGLSVRSLRALVREAATYLELSNQLRDNVMRLLHIAMLHDPAETGPHAQRVGAVASEIYSRWAERKNVPLEELRNFKSRLRLAAMLHDIGKVGISDLILKKPAKLTDEEFAVMRTHTSQGALLFPQDARDVGEMSHEIALHHHQKWNGKGYPEVNGACPAGEEIPLSARIVAIADVFDALVSPRCYKQPWSFEKALGVLREDAGTHFDPDLVTCMEEIMDTVDLIYKRYPDEKAPEEPKA